MKILRVIVLLLVLGAMPAGAASVAGDQNDWWSSPGEDGWAINVAHQGDTVFIAWFVYASNGSPVWYSGAGRLTGSASNPVFTGDLIATTGPWFGGNYNAGAVVRRVVGSFTFTPTAQNSARLVYTADGVPVDKPMQRFLFKYDNLTGTYAAAQSWWGTGCGVPDDGRNEDDFPLQITHNADNTVLIVAGVAPNVCSFTGTYTQGGHLGTVTGTGACPGEPSSTITLTELNVSTAGFIARFTTQTGSCRETGNIVGARRVTGP